MQDKKHGHSLHFGGQILPGFDPEVLLAREEHRKAMLPPNEILPQFLTRSDAVMLDLGCGAGFFTLPAAKFLTAGKVYAADLQKSMVDTTLRRATEAQLSNVEGIIAPAASVPLADSSVDAVLMSMMLHDIDTRTEALAEVARVLKPGGTLFMIEIDRIDGGFGPPMEVRIPPVELRVMLRDAGLTVLDVTDSPRQKSIYFLRAELPLA
jgi:ubiquinone/menaquinone biosynthesis C-methylase UbiE